MLQSYAHYSSKQVTISWFRKLLSTPLQDYYFDILFYAKFFRVIGFHSDFKLSTGSATAAFID